MHIRAQAKASPPAQQLMRLAGVGPTTATAIVAMVGNAREFSSSRQFAAWLGLVPGQYSSGGKTRLGRITKAGDPYLRSLLVMGARAVLAAAAGKRDPISRWATQLAERRGYWRAVVALAAKNAHGLGRARPRRGVQAAGVMHAWAPAMAASLQSTTHPAAFPPAGREPQRSPCSGAKRRAALRRVRLYDWSGLWPPAQTPSSWLARC